MKNLSLALAVLFSSLITLTSYGQTSYNVSGPTNGQGPLLNTESTSSSTGWTAIHLDTDNGGNTVNSWSDAEDIGFNFEFYGVPVDSFCVSKNFLLTFNTSLAATTLPVGINTNSAMPFAGLPDSTIAYFWGTFANGTVSLGTNDDVWRKTFGTAPNRQLWIKNFSYEAEGQSFSYNFVVLEETTNNIYIVDARNATLGGGGWTVGVQLDSTTAVQHASSPAIVALHGNSTTPWPNVDYYMFEPFLLIPNNVGVASIDGPQDTCGLSSTETVTITLENIGTADQSNIPVQYSLNGGAFVSAGTFSGPLVAGTTATHTFTADLSGIQLHELVVATNHVGDSVQNNDTATAFIQNFPIISSYPYQESFEGVSHGWVSGGTNGTWELGAPANVTINSASDGTQAWVTNLTGSYNVNDNSFVLGPCFDFTSLTNPEVLVDVWWESENSWDGAALQYSTDDGNTWTHVGAFGDPNNWYSDATVNGLAFSGNQHGWSGYFGNGSNGWVTAKNDLTGLGGSNAVRLRIVFGSDGSVTGEGFAFDKFIIREKPANDIGIVEVVSPGDGCALGSEILEVAIEGFGTADQTTYDVSFQVNGGAVTTQSFTSDTVFSLDTIHLELDSLIDLSLVGTNNVAIWTTLVGDFDNTNDTLFTTITHEAISINTFPHLEDWETLNNEDNGVLSNGWIGDRTVDPRWEAEDASGGNENSSNTGPFWDNTTYGTPGGIYMFMETSSGTTGQETNLTSPCIDISALNNPFLDYYYHMYGTAMGQLRVDIIGSGGVVTQNVDVTVGQQQTAGSDPWIKSSIDLASFAGEVIKINFRGVRGSSFTSDMSIDDVRVYDQPINDAGIISMDAPGIPGTPGVQNVEVSIKNFGLDTLISANINWEAGGVLQTPFSWTGSLATDSVDNNVNIGSFNFLAGVTDLVFYTSSPNGFSDDETSNDTLETFFCTPLSGFYSIGAGGDFVDLAEALNILYTCGVDGATTFDVLTGAGPFDGQVIFTAIPGASSANNVTFNGNGEVITYTPAFTDKRIVGFDGAKHIILNNFVIQSGSPTYGFGVHLMNGSDSNVVSLCHIDLSNITSTSSVNSGGIVASGSITSTTTDGNNTNSSLFGDNLITGGASGGPYVGIYLNGQGTGTDCFDNIIFNNEIVNFYSQGIYLDEVDSATVTENELHRPDRTASTTIQFITLQGKTEKTLIEKNELHNSHGSQPTYTGSVYGIYNTSDDADVGDENIIVNNIIHDINHNGTIYGIYNFSSNGQRYYHNTISLDNTAATGGTTRGFYQTTTASNLEFRNNIISITRGGTGQKHALYFNSTGSTINSETNNLYVNSAGSGLQYTGRFGTTNYATLANWQTANGGIYDSLSTADDPLFVDVNNGDLTPNQPTIDNTGALLLVVDDFNSNFRSGSTPDVGAIEFSVATNDVTIIELISPVVPGAPNCGLTNAESVTVAVKNLGTTTVTSLPVSYVIDNGSPVTETFTDSIAFNDTVHLTFSTLADLSMNLVYDLEFYTDLVGDIDTTNDTLTETLTMGIPAPYFEDFETFGAGFQTDYPNGWFTFNSNNNTSNPRWEGENSTGANENSGGTGPFFDNTSFGTPGGHYMYMETSSPSFTGDTAYLVTPCIDISGLNHPFLSYYYHLFGNTMGNLYTEVLDGGTWVRVDSVIGQQQTAGGDPYEERLINLCDISSDIIRIRFCGAAGPGFGSDMSIDDFEVFDMPPFSDAAVGDLTVDPSEYCQTPLPQVVPYSFEGRVANLGIDSITGVTLTVTAGSFTEVASIGSMADCNNDSLYAFTGAFTPTSAAIYPVDLTVTINETDTITDNDSAETEIVISDTIYARDDSSITNGIGSNTGVLEIGQMFEMITADTLTSISFNLTAPVVGDSVRLKIYDFAGGPTTLVDSSEAILITGPGWYHHVLCNYVLDTGQYFIAVEQLVGTNNMSLSYTLNKFTPNTAYFGTNGGVWTTLEGAGFPSALLLRANFGHPAQVSLTGTDTICAGDTTSIIANLGFIGYSWSNGDTTSSSDVIAAGTYTVTATDGNGCTSTDDFDIFVNPSPAPTITQTSGVSCQGLMDGSLLATGTNGNTPYSYSWSNGDTTAAANNIGAGTHTVTVTDANGCSDTAVIVVTAPTSLTASAVVNANVICNGDSTGSATGSGIGGTTPYVFTWSSGETGATEATLLAGLQTVTVTDANGCNDTASVTITEPAAIISTMIVDSNISCNGFFDGGATASTTGGTGAYTFSWSNSATTASITGVAAGTYTITVTDASGCTGVDNVTITEPAVLVASTTVDNNISCNGLSDGGATVSGTGGTTSYNYSWSNSATTASITGVVAGTYSVTITDANGCTDSSSVTITEPAVLVSSAVVDSTISCNGLSDGGATASATGGTTSYTYAWSNGATTAGITGVIAGSYSVTITDANGCTDSSSVTITEPTVLVSSAVVDSNVTCNGFLDGGATASGTGGTGSYAYTWSNSATTASITGVGAGTYTVTITDANGCTDSSSVTITEPTALVASAVVDSNVTCNGFLDGGATSTGTGGTGAYAYAWSNSATTASITGVGAGTYTVTITDANGCTDSASVIITEPATLVSSAVVDSNITCNGFSDGGATSSATGGTGAYNYAWSNSATTASITGVVAGGYSVTITDANGCTDSSSVIITQPDSLIASISNTVNVSCFGLSDGSATVSATGGTLNYSYLWDSGNTDTTDTSLSLGMYTVIVTDANGCIDSAIANITQPDSLTDSISFVDATCFGGSDGSAIAVPNGGTAPYSYQWDDSNGTTTDSVSGLEEGTYTVVITDTNNCTITDSVTIGFINPLPVVNAGPDTTICFGMDIDLDATGDAGSTYLWNTGETTPIINVDSTAIYIVTCTDVNGCSGVDSVDVLVDGICPGIGELEDGVEIRYYPNPSDGLINIQVVGMAGERVMIQVYSITGRQVFSTRERISSGHYTTQIDLAKEAQGIYFIRLTTKRNSFVDRVVVE